MSQRSLGLHLTDDKSQASSRINHYERDRFAMSVGALDKLAKALAVPPAYLVSLTAEQADAALVLANNQHIGSNRAALALLEWLHRSPELQAALDAWASVPDSQRPTADALIHALLQAIATR